MIIDAMATACRVDLETFGGIQVNLDDLKTILNQDTALYKQLDESYNFETYNGEHGLDTYDRDYVFDAFAKFIGGDYWPCNMDHGTKYAAEFTKLLAKYSEGIK